ncbi:hypothetical protein BRETT_000180 [Brettanomyces bruxellensis]|uniref:Kinesin-like protein n=1 Tax=Dekkera bruxellensis TaxID=5007 RepID=A0A871QYT9_DEKBR|nr:uncharacterized protein BRETT_000180 [Brettanomyces bruxellensis]QOU18453.1 hypothetical protein BRETT_000180 [Brettanomyces bruxellensis]
MLRDITNQKVCEKWPALKKRKIQDGSAKYLSGSNQESKNSSENYIDRSTSMGSAIDLSEQLDRERKKELMEVRTEKGSAKSQLQHLQGKLWEVRENLPELQVEVDKLQKEYEILVNKCSEKEVKIQNIGKQRVKSINDLQVQFECFKKKQEESFNNQINIIADECDKKAYAVVLKKQKEFYEKEQMTKRLCDKNREELKKLQVNFDQKKALLEEQYKLKLTTKLLERERMIKDLKQSIESLGSQLKGFEFDKHKLSDSLSRQKEENQKLDNKYQNVKREAEKFRQRTDFLRVEVDKKASHLTDLKERKHTLLQKISSFREGEIELKEKYIEQHKLELELRERLQNLKGNIRVFCRVKPSNDHIAFDIKYGQASQDSDLKDHIEITKPKDSHDSIPASTVLNHLRSYSFVFDKVFDQYATNQKIFEEVGQMVQSAIDGYNVCIFAYGQTGSGKTYTMSKPGDGVIPLSIKKVFSCIKEYKELGWSFKVDGQFIEIYGDSINDLLADTYIRKLDRSQIQIKQLKLEKKVVLTNVSTFALKSPAEVNKLLAKADGNRKTASTRMNDRSSRSHTVFIIGVHGNNVKTGKSVNGVLNLIDLAGSERVDKSQVKGIHLHEAQAINTSLSALGDVISSINSKNSHIPYRNSKLTYLLQYSLGGNSKTLMFVNVSSSAEHFNETLNSLRFAQKVNNTHIGSAKKIAE